MKIELELVKVLFFWLEKILKEKTVHAFDVQDIKLVFPG